MTDKIPEPYIKELVKRSGGKYVRNEGITTDKKILEVLNVNDSLIFVWGTDEQPIQFDYNDMTGEQKNAWKIVSDLLVNL